MLTEQEQKHLDEVMDNFGFAQVASAMQHLNWQWAVQGNRDEMEVPDERRLRTTVRQRSQMAIEMARTNTGHAPGKGFYGSGGFHIEAEAENGVLQSLYVRFTLTEWGTEAEE